MSVIVNGHPQPLPEPGTVAALLKLLAPAAPYAVARNGDFVSHHDYAECRILPGDCIDIVHPAAGG
jgi:sulfur carrier protein